MNRTSNSGKMLALCFLTVSVHALIVLAIVSQRRSYGPGGADVMFKDVRLFYAYASKAMAGAIPYREYPIEYPPGAFPLFFIPRLFASTFEGYKVAFGLEMLLADALIVFLIIRWLARTEGYRVILGRLCWYTLFFAVSCPLLVSRFDLAAAAFGFAAACAWFSERPRLGGLIAGLGTLVKIFPGVLVIPAFCREPARGWGGLRAFGATLVVGSICWLGLAGSRIGDFFQYHLERGLEIGSIYAGFLMILERAGGLVARIEFLHESVEYSSPASGAVTRLGLPLQILALGLVAWRAWKEREQGDPMRLAAASVLGFIVFGKVLSPQYLIWLFPFVTVLQGRSGRWARGLFLFACVVTTMLFPHAFHWLLARRGWAVGLLNYRNAVLLVLWGLLLVGSSRSGRDEKPSEGESVDDRETSMLADVT